MNALLAIAVASVARASAQAAPATINAASLSLADVQSAVTQAFDGDTVVLPAGDSPDWSGPVAVSGKNIAVIGAGTLTGGTTINLLADGFHITTINSDATARLSNLHIHMKAAYPNGSGKAIGFDGNSIVHLNSAGAVSGGFRLDHVRFTIETVALSTSNYILVVGGYLTGVIDHNFVDYPADAAGSEITDISQLASATGDTTPEGTAAKRGVWSFFKPYVYAGGLGINKELDAIYFEDNIVNRSGAFLDSLRGGARIVARYNSSRGHFGGHGLDSGDDMGKRASEFYNNLFTPTLPSNPFPVFGVRGGGHVIFGNRMQQWSKPWCQLMFFRPGGNASMIGLADGTNFFDLNERDTLNVNGTTFVPVRVPSDARIGAVYAQGTGGTQVGTSSSVYQITGLDGGSAAGKWKGFVITNATKRNCDESLGSQSNTCVAGSNAIILDSTAGLDSTVTVGGNATSGHIGIGASSQWEIRRVKSYFNIPGSGQMDSEMNGGSIAAGSLPGPPLLTSGTPNPRWTHEVGDGLWQWDNQYQAAAGGAWAPMPSMATGSNGGSNDVWPQITPGGIHDNAVMPGYPPVSDNARRRVGADWDPNAIQPSDPAAPTQAYGGIYPHPLVSGVPPSSKTPAKPTGLRVR